jgi:hypothetical protein
MSEVYSQQDQEKKKKLKFLWLSGPWSLDKCEKGMHIAELPIKVFISCQGEIYTQKIKIQKDRMDRVVRRGCARNLRRSSSLLTGVYGMKKGYTKLRFPEK